MYKEKNCLMRSTTVCSPCLFKQSNQEGGACCMNGGDEKCIQDLVLNNQAQMGRIRLTLILLVLCDQFRFHKMHELSRLAENLLALMKESVPWGQARRTVTDHSTQNYNSVNALWRCETQCHTFSKETKLQDFENSVLKNT